MPILLKVVISGLVIGAINLVAQRSPGLAGWLAAFPLISFLSIVWLWADGRDNAALGDLVTGVLWGIIPTTLLMVVLLLCIRSGLHVFAAMAVATMIWVAFTLVARAVGLLA